MSAARIPTLRKARSMGQPFSFGAWKFLIEGPN
jgi:hypothetical protein